MTNGASTCKVSISTAWTSHRFLETIVSEAKKPAGPKRVWRMTADMPAGGFVDSTSGAPVAADAAASAAAAALIPSRVLTPARVPSWHASSHDLLSGATASDVTDTIPGELFDELFKDGRADS
jgi:hypothetical protein